VKQDALTHGVSIYESVNKLYVGKKVVTVLELEFTHRRREREKERNQGQDPTLRKELDA
jgi:hypothetical protein